MHKEHRFSFRKGDLFAVALVVLLALAVAVVYLPDSSAGENHLVQIFQNGILIRELPLQTDAQFTLSGEYNNTIVVHGGRVCIETSDCPGGDCVHSGWIAHAGRSIVCLPNRVEIRVSGRADVDFVVR